MKSTSHLESNINQFFLGGYSTTQSFILTTHRIVRTTPRVPHLPFKTRSWISHSAFLTRNLVIQGPSEPKGWEGEIWDAHIPNVFMQCVAARPSQLPTPKDARPPRFASRSGNRQPLLWRRGWRSDEGEGCGEARPRFFLGQVNSGAGGNQVISWIECKADQDHLKGPNH